MDSGIGVAARVSESEPLGKGQGGVSIGLKYTREDGLGPTGQAVFKWPGVEVKYDIHGNLKIGLWKRIWSGGMIIDPSLFSDTINAWRDIWGGGECKGTDPSL